MRLLSGRVGVTSYAGLSTSRKQTPGLPGFLGLEEVEPNLGLPSNNNYVLYGTIEGERYWGAPSGAPSGSVDGIEVQKDEVTPTGFAGSITKLNFKGNGVTVEQLKLDLGGGIEVGIATMTINKSTNDVMDANGFTRASGITTFKVGAGLSFFPEPGQSGIVSIFSAADARTNVQNEDGSFGFGNVGTIRVGAGLTVNQVAVGIASIQVNGKFEHVNASGIITASQGFKGDLAGAGVTATSGFTGDLTGDVTGDLTGNVTGNVTGDVAGRLTGNFNSTGISTAGQLFVDTIQTTGIITAPAGFIAPVGSFGFLGSLFATGVSTITFLNGTNGNFAGIVTASSGLVGDVTGNTVGDVTGNINSTGVSTISQLIASTVNASGIITAGSISGTLTGTLTGKFNTIGVSTVTNELHIKSSDGSPGRINYYCEVGNAHYTQLKAAPHSEYSGNVVVTLPTKEGDVIVGDTAGAITQNIHTSGIITATSFAGNGANVTNVDALRVALNATNTTNAAHFLTFVDTATGTENVRTDSDLQYNPGTNTLTAGTLNGNATGLTGNPAISVGDVTLNGNMLPDADNTRNLGAAGTRWANVFTADMHFNNVGTGGNDVDGTEGSWTLQEGKDNIYMINKLTGKKYKISLTEV